MESEVEQDFKKYVKPNLLLSADQLVHQFKTLDKSIPPKGGSKDFKPDGSWLQGKKLDMVYSTKETLLAEQRTNRLGSILIGEWNRERNLVESKKDIRKFWSKMGFVDECRKWLYPEEALFLMESNGLLVYNEKVPLSIQQGYQVFLGKSLTRMQYQVYAHLRRIGYIVIRFENNSDFTPYERCLNINQYVKNKRKYYNKQYISSSEEEDLQEHETILKSNHAKKMRCIDSLDKSKEHDADVKFTVKEDKSLNVVLPNLNVSAKENTSCFEESSLKDSETGLCSEKIIQQKNLVCLRNSSENKDINMKDNEQSKVNENCENGDVVENIESLTIENKSNLVNRKECTDLIPSQNLKESPVEEHQLRRNLYQGYIDDINYFHSTGVNTGPKWDFSKYNIPNIAGQTFMYLSLPNEDIITTLLGEPLQSTEYTFNVQEYRDTVMCQHKYFRSTQNISFRNKPLKYSFKKSTVEPKKDAKNWSEYKEIMEKEKVEEQNTLSSLKLLWEDDIKPLLSPEDTMSTADVALQKLQIIENAQLHRKASSSLTASGDWNFIFDVYQPNSQFKKTDPGLPYFRVCVCRFDDKPPSLADFIHLTGLLKDQVPINWAFVDNGEVAFYTFQGVTIPKETFH